MCRFVTCMCHTCTSRVTEIAHSQTTKICVLQTQTSSIMPKSKKEGWIDWRKSPARQVLIADLEKGGPLYRRDNIPAEEVFVWYKQFAAFENVVLDQFKARLNDHRKQAQKRMFKSLQEEQYMIKDRQLYPREPKNGRGQLVFDMSPAKLLLREDVRKNVHLRMSARKLQKSREAYRPFDPNVFRHRIYQEVRLQKYFHYRDKKRNKVRNTEPPKPTADEELEEHEF